MLLKLDWSRFKNPLSCFSCSLAEQSRNVRYAGCSANSTRLVSRGYRWRVLGSGDRRIPFPARSPWKRGKKTRDGARDSITWKLVYSPVSTCFSVMSCRRMTPGLVSNDRYYCISRADRPLSSLLAASCAPHGPVCSTISECRWSNRP